jgi:hypothetical protein
MREWLCLQVDRIKDAGNRIAKSLWWWGDDDDEDYVVDIAEEVSVSDHYVSEGSQPYTSKCSHTTIFSLIKFNDTPPLRQATCAPNLLQHACSVNLI